MIILPAIELRHGRCVQLRKNDPTTAVVYADDPAQVARQWVEQGAQWLHVVNLDGAFDANQQQIESLGHLTNILIQSVNELEPTLVRQPAVAELPLNLQRLIEIRQATTRPIQFGGGLRTLEDIELALTLGADRIILGTIAVEDPALVSMAIQRWGAERIVVGLDAKEGRVMTHGWQKVSDVNAIELGHHMHAIGVRRVLYTDVSRDGTLSGVNVEAMSRLGDTTDLRVIAGGGVGTLQDIETLKSYEHFNIEGIVVGTALYNGDLNLTDAIEIGHRPLVHQSAGLVPFREAADGPEFLLLFNLFLEQWQFPSRRSRTKRK